MIPSKSKKFPSKLSHLTADGLKAVEYVSPYVRPRFTDPDENKVRPDELVQGGVLMEMPANSSW